MSIESMYERVWRYAHNNENDSIREIQESIIDLLAEKLKDLQPRLEYWEKEHLCAAINAFRDNANRQNGVIWLRLCLVPGESVRATGATQ